jgi:hypothetical protein
MPDRYAFILPDQIARGELKPLRDPRNIEDEGLNAVSVPLPPNPQTQR